MGYTNLDAGSGTYGVDEGGVNSVVTRMEDAISTLRTSLNQINESAGDVARGWKGQAHGEFVRAAEVWDAEVRDLNNKLDALSQAVSSGKNTIVGADSEGLV